MSNRRYNFVISPVDESSSSDVYILIGIRVFNKKRFKRKPPTRLINAWHAGVSFIGGGISARSRMEVPGSLSLRVCSCSEMIEAFVGLKTHSALYNRLVEPSRTRARDCTFDAIAHQWKELPEGDIYNAYRRWGQSQTKTLRHALSKVRHTSLFCLKKGFEPPTALLYSSA